MLGVCAELPLEGRLHETDIAIPNVTDVMYCCTPLRGVLATKRIPLGRPQVKGDAE